MNFLLEITVALVVVILVLLLSYIVLPRSEIVKDFFVRNQKWLSPNCISNWRKYGVFLIIVGLIFGILANDNTVSVITVWIFTFLAATDALDGQVARRCGLMSPEGAKLDAEADKYFDLPILFILSLIPIIEPIYLFFVIGVIIFDIIGQKMRGVNSPVEAGIVGKAKTTIKFIVIYFMSLIRYPEIYDILKLEIIIPVLLAAALILAGTSMGMKTKWYNEYLRKYLKEYLRTPA